MIYDIDKNKNILLAAELIINGNLIIYSTDTLYGFGVDASNTNAIKKLNQIKGRSQAYSIIVSSFEMLKKYANVDNVIENELKKIFPGAYTAILEKTNSNLSNLVTNNLSTVGIRIPDFDPILKIVDKINKPIITTSVNFHGESSLNQLKKIQSKFPDINIFTDFVERESKGSTIINFAVKPFNILRQGDGVY